MTGVVKRRRHTGLHADRTKPARDNPLERAFAKAWREANLSVLGTSSGSTLKYLLTEADDHRTVAHVYEANVITQRDATVAATVVQWLGTQVGQAFLEDVLRTPAGQKFLHDRLRVSPPPR